MKKLILYDLDGTIVDTRQDIINGVRYALQTLNGPELTDDEIKACVGIGLHALIKQAFRTEDQKLAEKGGKLYREHYKQHMLDHSRLYAGAKDLLDYFKSRTQAVITNKPDPFSSQILIALGVADYFIAILAGGNGLPAKPHPGAIHHLMEKAKVATPDVIFIGDSLIDIEAARNASVEVVALTHGFTPEATLREAKPDYIVQNLAELLQLAKEKGW